MAIFNSKLLKCQRALQCLDPLSGLYTLDPMMRDTDCYCIIAGQFEWAHNLIGSNCLWKVGIA